MTTTHTGLFSHIVLAINDGAKRNQLFYDAGFTLVHSMKELREVNWSDKECLLIQVGLNWLQTEKRQNTLYDGYFVLLEICERPIPFKGTIGMISCSIEKDMYNASNNTIFPLIKRLPFEFVHICDERETWDKKLLMRHYHAKYQSLKTECKKGFIQLNTGAKNKMFEVIHLRGISKVIARKNKSGVYIIQKAGIVGIFSKIGKSKTEDGIVEQLLKHFSPVQQLKSRTLAA